jgi:ABC-type iron transport system FetAB permease component
VPPVPVDAAGEAAAQRAFSTAMLVSAVRCLLTYIILPFVAPALGFASGVGPIVGIVIGVVAIAANLYTMRRFHRAQHRLRWVYTAIAGGVIALLLILMVQDIGRLL